MPSKKTNKSDKPVAKNALSIGALIRILQTQYDADEPCAYTLWTAEDVHYAADWTGIRTPTAAETDEILSRMRDTSDDSTDGERLDNLTREVIEEGDEGDDQ